jgi:hypothetical protein
MCRAGVALGLQQARNESRLELPDKRKRRRRYPRSGDKSVRYLSHQPCSRAPRFKAWRRSPVLLAEAILCRDSRASRSTFVITLRPPSTRVSLDGDHSICSATCSAARPLPIRTVVVVGGMVVGMLASWHRDLRSCGKIFFRESHCRTVGTCTFCAIHWVCGWGKPKGLAPACPKTALLVMLHAEGLLPADGDQRLGRRPSVLNGRCGSR